MSALTAPTPAASLSLSSRIYIRENEFRANIFTPTVQRATFGPGEVSLCWSRKVICPRCDVWAVSPGAGRLRVSRCRIGGRRFFADGGGGHQRRPHLYGTATLVVGLRATSRLAGHGWPAVGTACGVS